MNQFPANQGKGINSTAGTSQGIKRRKIRIKRVRKKNGGFGLQRKVKKEEKPSLADFLSGKANKGKNGGRGDEDVDEVIFCMKRSQPGSGFEEISGQNGKSAQKANLVKADDIISKDPIFEVN